MSEHPSPLRWLWRALAVLAVVLVLAIITVAVLLTTRGGQAFVAARVLEIVNGGGVTVSIGATDGTWPSHIVLENVTARDRQGQWLSIDRIDLRLHPSALLRGRVHAETLAIGNAAVARLPVSAPGGQPKPFDPEGLVGTLRHILVEHGEIAALRIGEPVIGASVDLQFTARLVPDGDGVALTSDMKRHDAPGTLSLSARGDARGLTVKLEGALGTLSAGANVTVTVSGGGIGGTVHVECTSPCLMQRDMRIDRAIADVTLGGTARAPHFDATVIANGLDATGRRLRELAGTLAVDIADDRARTLRVSGQGTFAGTKTAAPEAAQVVADTGTWALAVRRTGDTTVVEKLSVTSGDTEITADATLTPAGLAPAHLAISVRAPGRLGGVARDRSVARAELTLERALADGTANGRLHVQLSELAPPPRLAGVLGREATVAAKLDATPSGLRITDVTMVSGNLRITGQSTWTGPLATVVHQSSTIEAMVAANAVAGAPSPTHATFTLTGPLPTLHGELRASVPELRLDQSAPAENLTFVATGDRRGKGFEIAATGNGQWRNHPVELAVRAQKGDGPAIVIPQLHLGSAAGIVDGTGTVSSTDGTISGAVKASLADLSVVGAVAGIALSGAGEINAALAAPGGKQSIDLRVGLRNLKHDIFSADGLTLTTNVTDAYGLGQVRARLESGGGALLARPIKTVLVNANGDFANLAVTLAITGAARDPLNVSMAGHVSFDNAITGSLSRLRVQDGPLVAQLQGESQFTISADQLALSPTRIAIANGFVTAELKADRTADTATGTIAFQDIALSTLVAEAPTISTPSNTIISGRIAFSGPADATTVEAALDAGFDTGEGRGRLEIKALARDGRAAVTGTATGLGAEPARLSADVPLQISLAAMKARLDMDGPASASLKWTGDIGRIWPLVPLDDHMLSGMTAIDISASGTLNTPKVQGGLRLTEGTYENVPQSTVLHHVNLAITAESSDALLFTLAAKDRGEGTIEGKGRIVHNDATGDWEADIGTAFKNLVAFNRDDVVATLSGTLDYKGPLTHGALTGNFNVRKGEIRIDQVYAVHVPLLRPLGANREEARNRRTNREPERPQAASLNIAVTIDEPIRIDGHGLDSWWRGQIAVGGTTAAPDFTGVATADRGTFSFISQTFALDPSSKVILTGGGEIDPELTIVATKQTTDITARANITGRASAPKIELTSVPGLPQDEVLARLMFQKQTSQLGPIQSVQLASAAAELAGLSRGGLGGLLQRTFGIDQIGFGGSTGSSLVLGQQVGRNLYVGIEQNLRGTGRQIVLEWRLTRGLSLRSTTAGELGSDIGLSWRKDY